MPRTRLILYGAGRYCVIETEGANLCFNGICDLTGEVEIIRSCESSVTIFIADCDALLNRQTKDSEEKIEYFSSP